MADATRDFDNIGVRLELDQLRERIADLEDENERLREAAGLAGDVMRICARALTGNEDTVYAYREATQLLRDPLFGESNDG